MYRLRLPRFKPTRVRLPVFLLLASGLLALGGSGGCSDRISQDGADGLDVAELEVVALEVSEEYWPNGTLHVRRSVMTTDDGRRLNHGPLLVWYETGELRSEGYWRHGRKHGHFIFWYKNGQKEKEFTWSDGRGDGAFTAWDEQGNELRHELWRDGHKIEASATAKETGHARGPAASVTRTAQPPS